VLTKGRVAFVDAFSRHRRKPASSAARGQLIGLAKLGGNTAQLKTYRYFQRPHGQRPKHASTFFRREAEPLS